jgi:hypothetical protein
MIDGEFSPIDRPLVVNGVPFEVVRAYVAGEGFLDLVVVIDMRAGSARQLRHGYWLVERIAQALDHAKSRRPLTAVVLHDASAARVPTEDFLRVGRVLLVSDPDTVRDELAPILPIVLEPSNETERDPLETLLSRNNSGKDAEPKVSLIEAAAFGSDRVRSVFVDWIDSSFDSDGANRG